MKSTTKNGYPIFITRGKAGENSRQIPVLDKNGKPVNNWRGKPKTREYKYEGNAHAHAYTTP